MSASSLSSEVNSHPVHGLIHEGTYTFIITQSVAKSAENFSYDVGLTQCSVNGLIH